VRDILYLAFGRQCLGSSFPLGLLLVVEPIMAGATCSWLCTIVNVNDSMKERKNGEERKEGKESANSSDLYILQVRIPSPHLSPYSFQCETLTRLYTRPYVFYMCIGIELYVWKVCECT
jgi:hypothetical protein